MFDIECDNTLMINNNFYSILYFDGYLVQETCVDMWN